MTTRRWHPLCWGAFAALLLLGTACPPAAQNGQVSLDTEEQKTAYALGFQLGHNLHSLDLRPDEVAALSAGLSDSAAQAEPRIDVAAYQGKVADLARERAEAMAEKAKAANDAYLKKAAAEEGAQHFDSGLILIPTHEGEGPSPKPTDRVTVHYQGTFTNGEVFDSSIQRGQPATIPLNGVIPCWTEALQKLKVGGSAKLICPPELAYGVRGAPPHIPPAAVLIFDVQLLDIASNAPPAAHPAPGAKPPKPTSKPAPDAAPKG